jgi:hypothetical protein
MCEEHAIYISLTTMLKLRLGHDFYDFMPQVGFKPMTLYSRGTKQHTPSSKRDQYLKNNKHS